MKDRPSAKRSLAWGLGRLAWNHEAVISSRREAGAKASRLPLRIKSVFFESLPNPGRCFRRAPPEPPGHNKVCTGAPVTEGLPLTGWRFLSNPEACPSFWRRGSLFFVLGLLFFPFSFNELAFNPSPWPNTSEASLLHII